MHCVREDFKKEKKKPTSKQNFCIFSMVTDIGYLTVYSLTVHMPSSVKYLLKK